MDLEKVDRKALTSVPVKSSEITPEHIYQSRRRFLQQAGLVGLGFLLSACNLNKTSPEELVPGDVGSMVDERGDPLTSYESITNYNNYYEFASDKQSVAEKSSDLRTSPWDVKIDGLVRNKKTYALEDLLRKFPSEERIYRLRCVEGWSMVIPWLGFPLASILKEVEPLSTANFVLFETLHDPDQMPMQKSGFYPWPYREGLRLDEAMNDLTILATGLYGKDLPPQNGAPIRLVVPWKYGFKSCKAIVRITFVEEKPYTFWNSIEPMEYGFYANVNPMISHPTWSQASERRIGELERRETLMFNGYAEEVAHLYDGMDLRIDY